MRNSPDLSQETKKLQKLAETLKIQIQHRQNELQAVQLSLDNLEQEVGLRTASLIQAQERQLVENRRQSELKSSDLRSSIASLEEREAYLAPKVLRLERRKADLENDVADLDNFRREKAKSAHILLDQIAADTRDHEQLLSTSHEKELAIVRLDEHRESLLSEIAGLEQRIETLKKELSNLKADLKKQTEDKGKTIDVLEAKILKLAQEVDERQKEDEMVRHDLALQAEYLEERDKNLRIREQKVSQGEDKLLVNSDLLNL